MTNKSEGLILENDQGEQFALADLKQSRTSIVAGYIGKYVMNALADDMPCEKLAAELQKFKATEVGQAEIQRHKNQASDLHPTSELNPAIQDADQ